MFQICGLEGSPEAVAFRAAGGGQFVTQEACGTNDFGGNLEESVKQRPSPQSPTGLSGRGAGSFDVIVKNGNEDVLTEFHTLGVTALGIWSPSVKNSGRR